MALTRTVVTLGNKPDSAGQLKSMSGASSISSSRYEKIACTISSRYLLRALNSTHQIDKRSGEEKSRGPVQGAGVCATRAGGLRPAPALGWPPSSPGCPPLDPSPPTRFCAAAAEGRPPQRTAWQPRTTPARESMGTCRRVPHCAVARPAGGSTLQPRGHTAVWSSC